MVTLTVKDLIDFEDDIAQCFNSKMIKAPIHLSNDNEKQLIEIFASVNPDDFIFCSWRSHYHMLLKGIPSTELKNDILKGRSISLCYPKWKAFSSAIVGGNVSIALGTALSLKLTNSKHKVWCFVGEMTSCTGIFYECLNYATYQNLPITYVIENNGKSVCTDTYKTWNTNLLPYEPEIRSNQTVKISQYLWYYWYKLDKWPHAGSGTRIQF